MYAKFAENGVEEVVWSYLVSSWSAWSTISLLSFGACGSSWTLQSLRPNSSSLSLGRKLLERFCDMQVLLQKQESMIVGKEVLHASDGHFV